MKKALLIVMALQTVAAPQGTVLQVSPGGPYDTLAKARDAIRALRKQGRAAGPVTVRVRSGTYFLTELLVFGWC